jgi:hypothetical protein
MKTNFIAFLLFSMSVPAVELLAASDQVDPKKPGRPAGDGTIATPPQQGSSKTPSAEGKKSTRPERMQRISGVVTSVTSLDLVLTEYVRKERKIVRFVLRPDTVKEGEVRPGAQVNLEYQMEGDKNIAKRIRVQTARVRRQK